MIVRKQWSKEGETELHTQQKAPKSAENGSLVALDTLLNFKIWYYETAQEEGTTARLRQLPPEKIPPEHWAARERLREV